MTKEHTWCVIMAGGIGSRFWPMSRSDRPKQFLDFLGLGRTLLQQTYDRFLAVCEPQNILVVTNAQYAQLVKEQLPALADRQILQEPSRRNTAPCVAYASEVIASRDPEACMIVAPSDHLVLKEEAFHDTLRLALDKAHEDDRLVTLGIMPSRPDTGYGYIQFMDEDASHPRMKKVKTFTEKPDHETAVRFMESGDFLWNSGIFIWSVRSIRKAFKEHLPELHERFTAEAGAYGSAQEHSFIEKAYADCPNISIDYGIMEKASNVHVIVSEFGWSDLGTWGSLYTHLPRDGDDNAVVGDDTFIYDSSRNMVHMHDERLLVMQGMEDMIVVSTPDALLICRKQDEQKIRGFVNDLKSETGDRFI
jgi:mannose-1-phosphate guanylyltransferase